MMRLLAPMLALGFAALALRADEHEAAPEVHVAAPAPADADGDSHEAPLAGSPTNVEVPAPEGRPDHAATEPEQAESKPESAVAEKRAPHHGEAAEPRSESAATLQEGQGLLKLGAKLTDRGDYASAEIAYWQILKNRTYPKSQQTDALLSLARMYRKRGIFTKAAAVYEKFLKLYPEDDRVPDALLELGRSQRAMGAHKNAINSFYNVINSTLKLPPESYEHYQQLAKTAQFEIAETHFETGNFVEAAKFFDRLRLLDLAPEDRARAQFKSASALLKAGQADKASAMFSQFIEQWPKDTNVPEARYLLALTLRQLGRPQEALAITLALLRTEYDSAGADPRNWAYWQRRTGNQLANDFFQAGDTLSALSIYDGLTHLSDNPAWRLPILYQMGLCYERLRQSERAGKAYHEIVDTVAHPPGKDPASSELTELARMAEWRIGQLDWSGRVDGQLDRFFSVNSSSSPPAPAPSPSPAHDSHGDSAPAPGAL